MDALERQLAQSAQPSPVLLDLFSCNGPDGRRFMWLSFDGERLSWLGAKAIGAEALEAETLLFCQRYFLERPYALRDSVLSAERAERFLTDGR